MYEFCDGNQDVATETSILYLPEFREFKKQVVGNEYDIEIYTELGAPSYFCFFARSSGTDILQQPLIKTLSIRNLTTTKKSNVVTDLSISELYHLTQRNVHPQAQYDKTAFARRQTILLKTEDIGLMGLSQDEYQKPKRVFYRFTGLTDGPCIFYVVLVYNNRGLSIDGRRLETSRLHR